MNNAGINVAFGPLSDVDPAAFDKMVDVNLKGPWYLASRLAPRMGEHGGGCVINVLSVAALCTPAYSGIYAATKAGLKALTEVMAQEWAALGIRVNALCPGYFQTELNGEWFKTADGQALIQRIPQRRTGELHELNGPLLLLASDAGSLMTGAAITVDGGHVLSSL